LLVAQKVAKPVPTRQLYIGMNITHMNNKYKCNLMLFSFIFRFVNSTAYYGLSWSTSNLGGNQFFVFNLAGIVEFPAYTFLLLTLNRWGRKINISGFLILAGLALLATLAVPKSN